MTTIQQVRVAWIGSALVGPSVSTFYFAGAEPVGFRAALLDLYTPLAGAMSASSTVQIPSSGFELEDSTGEVTGVWTSGTVSQVVGLNTGNYAKGVGARYAWTTGGMTNNRRVRGSTYMVPLSAAAFDTDGTLNSSFVTGQQTAINGFVSDMAPAFVIWTKPIDGAGGKISTVESGQVGDRTSWLRSRRT